MSNTRRRRLTLAAATAAATALTVGAAAPGFARDTGTANRGGSAGSAGGYGYGPKTATPIKHLVVVFQENVSFDHYFGSYPTAANTDGTRFHAKAGTPTVNGLTRTLLTHNPNTAQPQRLGRPNQIVTCDQDHDYTAEQQAFDRGLMDKFVEYTGSGNCSANYPGEFYEPGLVMDYYDGNTVTALWNYAQRFSMSDNFYGTTFGPSSPGAINLASGQTHGIYSVDPKTGKQTPKPDDYTVAYPNAKGIGTMINDPDPAWDDCSSTAYPRGAMTGRNIGDLLNAKHVTWGWFEGGFRPTAYSGTSYDGKPMAVCGSSSKNYIGATVTDYIPHHEPFQYYRSTANPHHLPPTSVRMIGRTDQANHQYGLADFYSALRHDNLPAVSFLKAPAVQDGHAGYSDPLDEQEFITRVLNRLQRSSDWNSTAVVVAYDDSDGWYDHQMSPIVNSSSGQHDAFNAPGSCGNGRPLAGYRGRCGYGPRLPLLVISPWSKRNYVDNAITDQTSIIRFVEDNWLGGRRIGGGSFDALAGTLGGMLQWRHPHTRRLILDPTTGAVLKY